MTEGPPRLTVARLRIVQASSAADVVDEVSFRLREGETLGLVGESGSGKTTVALALLGYARRGLTIAAGSVTVDGVEVVGMRARQIRGLRGSRVAYVPQDPASALNPGLKIGTQLREMLSKHSGPVSDQDAIDRRLDEVLSEVRLERRDVLQAYPHQLSGGQQQRVAIAMAFALRPSVIVLDEPTTGLDVTTQRHILNTIRGLCTSYGVAGIFVSHDLAVIAELVDQVAVMYAGRIVELGPKREVFASPAHPYTRGLLRAIPSPDRSLELAGVEGQPPRPGSRPPGCFFAPRCEFVQNRCWVDPPRLAPVGGGEHHVRCVRVGELPAFVGLTGRRDVTRRRRDEGRALLTVRSVSASYGAIEVVHSVSLEVHPQECVAVVGESGSGKTTLARCIVGLHSRWSGTITFNSMPLAPWFRDRPTDGLRSIQYVFQNPYSSLNPRKRVEEIVEQPLTRFFNLGPRERSRRLVAALEDASLDASFRRLMPAELSGGERQRVAIARAIVSEPEIIVCDEITSSLDVSVQATIVEMLRRLQSERGLALVFIAHDLGLVRSIAGRVVVMHDGKVVEQGDTERVLDEPQEQYTQRLLADIPRPYRRSTQTSSVPPHPNLATVAPEFKRQGRSPNA